MPIQKLKPSGGVMGSKAASVAVGFATGGPAGAALALGAANNPNIGKIANAMSMGKAAAGAAPAAEVEGFEMPELGAKFEGNAPSLVDSPMARRYSLAPEQDHAAVVEDGLAGLQELREKYPELYGGIAEEVAPALLQAKHFHLGKGR